ncbi:MAG: hypothetical protein CBB71_02335 [Rhodopirellula sp. TMED11]|nr:MAG: hypothetical protein CBB71_02335 [Rhodopirellula sp. TMED11]
MQRTTAFLRLAATGLLLSIATLSSAADLESGKHLIKQSWSQESNYPRPYFVHLPQLAKSKPLPVLVFLHGNGGNAEGAMRGFVNKHPKIAQQYLLVFPEGYQKSWNIVSERSRADDISFVEAVVRAVVSHDNASNEKVSLLGVSNGAALVNAFMIESDLSVVHNCITAVSPLNAYQFDGKHFRARGKDNAYRQQVKPQLGRRLLNISGTQDHLVPYLGGPSPVIPAKDGKLTFVDAEESTYQWAKAMGYQGRKLNSATSQDASVEVFSYLNGDVVHFKVNGEGHGAFRAIDQEKLLQFLRH